MIRTDSSSTTDSMPSSPSALERIYDHHLKESNGDPIPFGKREKTAVGIEVAGSTAGAYYGPSAWAAADALWLKTSLVLGNVTVGTLFLVKATDDLSEAILRESQAPEKIKDLVNLPSRRDLIIKYSKMVVGSTVCSIPFGIATYLFPLPGCAQVMGCIPITVTHSTITNTILHGVSWNVILTPKYKIYRFPFLPFEMGYECYQQSKMTLLEKELLKLDKNKEKIYQKYREHLSQYFNSKSLKIINSHLRHPNGEASVFLRNVKDPNSSVMTMAQVDEKENKISTSTTTESSSRIWGLCVSVHGVMRKGVGVAGAVFMTLGCIGWVANPIYICLSSGFSVFQSILLGALPAYSMGVLVAFYGQNIFQQIYDYLTTWDGDKFPLEAKLYPLSFTIFLLINAYLSVFSYGTAQVLISTIFGAEMWDAYRPILQAFAYPAVPVLSFVPFLDLFTVFVRKTTAKFGKESDEKIYSRLLVSAAAMSQEILLMKGKELIDSIQRYTPEQQKFLGIHPEEFKADEEELSRLEQQIMLQRSSSMDGLESVSEQSCFPCCKYPFWKSSREKELLLVNSSESLDSLTP